MAADIGLIPEFPDGSNVDKATVRTAVGETINHVIADVAALKASDLSGIDRVQTLGYASDGDGGHDEFYATGNTGTASSGTWPTYYDSAGNEYTSLYSTRHVRMEFFGVQAGVASDQSTAAQAAIDAAESLEIPVVSKGNGVSDKIRIDNGLTIDVYKTRWIGEGTVFDCSNMSATDYALTVEASGTFTNGRIKNSLGHVSNVSFVGNKTSGVHGLRVGSTTTDYHGQISIRHCHFVDFDRNVEFIDNAWRIALYNCTLEGCLNYHIYTASATTNFGEVMEFHHCKISGDNGILDLRNVQWDFVGCSFLNAIVQCTAASPASPRVNITGGNIENAGSPANTGYRMIDISNDDALVVLTGTRIVINQPGGGNNWEISPFRNTSSKGRLVLNGVQFPATASWFDPAISDGYSALVNGDGPVFCTSGFTFSNLSGNTNLAIAKSCNQLRNGDAEENSTDGWTVSSYGSGTSTFTATAGSADNGSYGFHAQCATSGGIEVRQEIKCNPGALVICNFRLRLISGEVFVYIRYLNDFDQALNDYYDEVAATFTTLGSYTTYDVAGYAPPGAVAAFIEFNFQAASPATEAYLDDVICNVI